MSFIHSTLGGLTSLFLRTSMFPHTSKCRLPNASSVPTAIAYFSVAKLDSPPDVGGTGVASGRYGCHVDPSATTMIQTGLANSPVPDAYSYLGIGMYACLRCPCMSSRTNTYSLT